MSDARDGYQPACRELTGKMPGKFCRACVQQIPRLSIIDIYFRPRQEYTRIIQTRRDHTDDSALGIFRAGQSRAALAAESSQIMSPAIALRRKMLNGALGQAERCERKYNCWNIGAAGNPLAVAAMTFKHE